MSFNKKHIAYIETVSNSNFTVRITTYNSMTRREQKEVNELFADFGGKCIHSTQQWMFDNSKKDKLANEMNGFGFQVTTAYSDKGQFDLTAKATKAPGYTLFEASSKPTIINPVPKPVMVAVPKSKMVIADAKPKVKPPSINDIFSLQKEFLQLHQKYGTNKTNMIEILRKSVPSMNPSTIFQA